MTPVSRSRNSIQESRDHLIEELRDLYEPLPYNEIQSLFTSSLNTSSPPSPSTQVAKAAAAPHLDPFTNTPQKTLAARGTLLPQPSTAKKRRRGRHPEGTTIGQSNSASSTASAASASAPRGNITDSSKRGCNTWELRYNELVSLHSKMLFVCAIVFVILLTHSCSFFSSSSNSCMTIVMFRRITLRIPVLASG